MGAGENTSHVLIILLSSGSLALSLFLALSSKIDFPWAIYLRLSLLYQKKKDWLSRRDK